MVSTADAQYWTVFLKEAKALIAATIGKRVAFTLKYRPDSWCCY